MCRLACKSRGDQPPRAPGSGPALWLALCLLLAVFSTVRAQETGPPPFRIGFSSSTFGEVNQNDALAAVKVWADALAKENDILLDPQPRVFRGVVEVAEALRAKRLDAVSLATDEYWVLSEQLSFDRCILGMQNDRPTQEFVVLVRQKSGIDQLHDLKGHSLALFKGPQMRMAPVWIETLLLQEKLGDLSSFCGRIAPVEKLMQAVLPVFFGKIDACLVTRQGFETMVELNPQVGRDLKVLVTSPSVVPFMFAFRADYTSRGRDQVLAKLSDWHNSPGGKQILTIFQCDRLEERPMSVLSNTLALLENHARLQGVTNRAAAVEMRFLIEQTKTGGQQ